MCYPTSVLIHVYLREIPDDQFTALSALPGVTCRRTDDGMVRARVELAHDVPSHPDLDELQSRFLTLVRETAPDATVVDCRSGNRYAGDFSSPAEAALHRLRSVLTRCAHDDPGLAEAAREFAIVDTWMSDGGTPPADWARRAPERDRELQRLVADIATGEDATGEDVLIPV